MPAESRMHGLASDSRCKTSNLEGKPLAANRQWSTGKIHGSEGAPDFAKPTLRAPAHPAQLGLVAGVPWEGSTSQPAHGPAGRRRYALARPSI